MATGEFALRNAVLVFSVIVLEEKPRLPASYGKPRQAQSSLHPIASTLNRACQNTLVRPDGLGGVLLVGPATDDSELALKETPRDTQNPIGSAASLQPRP